MRIISEKTVKSWCEQWPDASNWLRGWLKTAERAHWNSLADVRRDYPHADGVAVESGKTVTVFNARGNKHRLIASIHYNRGIVFTLYFLTHAEYSKDHWKDTL